MEVILLLVAISLTVACGFLLAFFWAVKDGQYDDDFTPSMRILIDEEVGPEKVQHHVSQPKSTDIPLVTRKNPKY